MLVLKVVLPLLEERWGETSCCPIGIPSTRDLLCWCVYSVRYIQVTCTVNPAPRIAMVTSSKSVGGMEGCSALFEPCFIRPAGDQFNYFGRDLNQHHFLFYARLFVWHVRVVFAILAYN